MLHFLPGPIIGCFSVILYIVNTILWLVPILIFSLLKAIGPIPLWQKFFSYLLDQMASNWVLFNTFIQKLFTKTKINASGLEKLKMKDWYLVISNHQSWTDILVLQRVFHGKIPFLKFFLKRELIYVPLLGLAWWALDFPFMKRYSQHFLKKNPHLKGKDIETTKKACEKFKHKPVSVMNFIEGTRFTEEKHNKQNSPFQRLLKPKAGGIGFVLQAMKGNLSKVVNVTIYYPDGEPNFLDFLSGKIKRVNIAIETQDIGDSLKGDYVNDRAYKIQFQKWVNQLWLDKDKKMLQLEEQANKDN
ncbi:MULTISPECIES: acyltransferase [unclassified Colwellia]|jgi:1-acyl-sn-glycerol-3-phosphate acyltransferase|uniref:acyltransferase n=1 Tax=unclassified Colwellia TaxID=196834 RepID=UPI000D3808F6|nr:MULTISPECIES: acyltransferase [unclassified Colwellia]AWB59252.1 acyltransferase [Colwellia sp. Arc7-D]MBA6415093.1 acyltransferase [Colwellia sp. 6M3]|tara:strand:- start:1728 stop:2633 length:906 start_codon:yes stop_codon:yes gene_type:complete